MIFEIVPAFIQIDDDDIIKVEDITDKNTKTNVVCKIGWEDCDKYIYRTNKQDAPNENQ